MEVLHKYGSEAQKKQWLEPLLAGDIRSCFGMTEPQNPGSNPVWMDTVAVKVGDNFVINGNKWFTSSADGASICVVMAVTDPDAENKSGAISLSLINVSIKLHDCIISSAI